MIVITLSNYFIIYGLIRLELMKDAVYVCLHMHMEDHYQNLEGIELHLKNYLC